MTCEVGPWLKQILYVAIDSGVSGQGLNPASVEFFSDVNGFILHKALYYHPSIGLV